MVRWLGHATVELRVGRLTVITDPLVTDRVAHLRRRVDPVEPVAADVVLISHLHLDHLHVPSLRRVIRADRATRVIVPAGAAPLLGPLDSAVRVTEVLAGDEVTVDGGDGAVTIVATPAVHSCGRGPHSRLRAEPVGYTIAGGGHTAYFAGDTDLFDGMHALGPIDTALLPIWGWGSTLGPGHLDPERAATAVAWIEPAVVVPIHWGTYSPVRARRGSPAWFESPLDAFREALLARGLDDRLLALRPGTVAVGVD